ncbi:MAG TPA: hypothetical protein VMV28_01380 [Thermoplasmata archaeon]|nr:hypothetical protein [Thermoplasmata archaeon]
MIFAPTVTSGFLRRVAGTPLAPYGTALAPRITTGSFAYAALLLPSVALRVAFSPIADVSLFQGIHPIVGSLAGAVLCAWLLRSDPDAA